MVPEGSAVAGGAGPRWEGWGWFGAAGKNPFVTAAPTGLSAQKFNIWKQWGILLRGWKTARSAVEPQPVPAGKDGKLLIRPFFKQIKNGYAKGSVLSYYAFGERTQNDESKHVFFLCSAPNNISNLIKAAPAFSFSGIETHIAAPTINFHCLQLRTLPRYVP